MHSTIAIPADVDPARLDRALASIGLRRDGAGRYMHAPPGQTWPCAIDGCEDSAIALDRAQSLCARHGMRLRSAR